jgi:septum site-determining protein MinC
MNELAPGVSESDIVRVVYEDVPVLVFDEDVRFEELREGVRELMAPHERIGDADWKNPLQGKAVRLDFGDRNWELFDLRRLVHLLRDEFGVVTMGLCCTRRSFHRYAEQELKMRVYFRPEPGDPPAKAAPIEAPKAESAKVEAPKIEAPPVSPPRAAELGVEGGRKALTLDHTIRSGTNVRFPGDIIIYGDVNSGAHIEAGGSILVLGSLRGIAHAGAPQDESAVIMAFELRPTQLRIGKKIGYPPEKVRAESGGLLSLFKSDKSAKPAFSPEIAVVRDGTIVLEDYRGRIPG